MNIFLKTASSPCLYITAGMADLAGPGSERPQLVQPLSIPLLNTLVACEMRRGRLLGIMLISSAKIRWRTVFSFITETTGGNKALRRTFVRASPFYSQPSATSESISRGNAFSTAACQFACRSSERVFPYLLGMGCSISTCIGIHTLSTWPQRFRLSRKHLINTELSAETKLQRTTTSIHVYSTLSSFCKLFC